MSATSSVKFQGREKGRDVRTNNIVAARAVADMVRTSLGPKGMDKMITASNGEVIISNDGATIVSKLETFHPSAKMMIDLSKAQDVEAGDGTTSVIVIAGALLGAAQQLLDKGIHPSVISDAWATAVEEAEKILKEIAIPIDLKDTANLVDIATTSLNSKVVSCNSEQLAPIAVEAVMRIINPEVATTVDLNMIKVVGKLGGTIEDSELVDGLVLPQGKMEGTPGTVKGARIAMIQYCLSAAKTNIEHQVTVEDNESLDRILKEERQYIQKLVKPIIKARCNVLLIQKSILRDAVSEMALHYLKSKGIMVVADIDRTDVEFISQTLGLTPIADSDSFTADKMGEAELASEMSTSSGKIIKITGVKNPGKTVSVLVRGSNAHMIDEAVRSIHDALCVVRCLVKVKYMVAGGGAPETAMNLHLAKRADSIGDVKGYCIRTFAKALEIIPYTLSENMGLNPIQTVTELRKQHAEGNHYAGIFLRGIADTRNKKVLQPLLVSLSSIKLATECCRVILKIDDIVAVR